MAQKLPHEPALDGLRAVAILMVVVGHMFQLASGWIGVHLFFVLSGYLITRILSAEIDCTGTIDFYRFYWRRFLRLMPPLWAMLLTFLPLILLGHHQRAQLQSWSMAATYLMNFNAAFEWMSNEAFVHTWSLATEEQFYLLWPAALVLVARHRPRLALTALLIGAMCWRAYLCLHGASVNRIYYGPDANSDSLIVGCLLGFTRISDVWVKRVSASWPLWIPAISIAMFAVTHYESRLVATAIVGDLVAVLGVLIIIAAPTCRALSTRPMVFIGKISYSLYLWHLPLIGFSQTRWHLADWQLIFPALCAFGFAVLSYYTVEAWGRRVKRRLDLPLRSESVRLRGHKSIVAPSG